MEVLQSCRCCLLRPPDRGLKTPYTHRDQTEVYSDMIEECFNIHLTLDNEDCGICEACVGRLRDARDFKLQVQRSQAELQAGWARVLLVTENEPSVKFEMDDNDCRSDEFPLTEGPTVKSEISDDGMSDENPISLSYDGCAPAPLEPARAAAARAREQLAMACSVRLERLRDDKAPHASPTCRQTFRHEATLAAHARGHARHDAGPGEEARDASEARAGEDTYTCDYCGEHLTAKISLIKHIRKHMTNTPDTSEICSKQLPTKYSHTKHEVHAHGKQHQRIHTVEKRKFVCEICEKRFTQRRGLKLHIRTHTGHKPYSCHICNKQFTQKNNLREHIRIHMKLKPYACDNCPKKFTKSQHLKRHQIIHTGEKPFVCEICEKRFIQNSDLKIHITIHTGHKPYACDICNKQFTRKIALNKHISTHMGLKPYATDNSSKKFIQTQHLKQNQRVHTGEKPFVCEICEKRFTRKSALTVHIRTHTGHKPYACDICNKHFALNSSLNKHIRIHTGVKPYACDNCPKKFTISQNLKRHQRIHTGEKHFVCEICEKRFIQKSALNDHITIHTGHKAYACDICNRQFTLKNYLRRHISRHT